MHTAFDTVAHCTPYLPALVAEGAKGGSRYIAAGGNYKLTDRAEIDAMHAHDMMVFLNFEEAGDHIGAISAAQAKKDAQRALVFARDTLGAPKGVAISFSCEPDSRFGAINVITDYPNRIQPYYAEVQQILGDQYRVGAYTFGGWWRKLLAAKLIDFPWLPGASGWYGYQDALASNLWAMRQLTYAEHGLEQNFYAPGITAPLQVDWDALNPAMTDVGAWVSESGALPPEFPADEPLPDTVRRGSTGEVVKQLQRALGVTVDGQFGPLTDKAVRAYQTAHGLVPDGIVGPLSWAVLLKSAA